MSRYYDHKSVDCATCGYLGEGTYTDGRPYEVCRNYGYILHPWKGISPERCKGFATPQTVARLEEIRRQKQRKKR